MASIQPLSRVGVDPHADTLAASGTDAVGVELFHLEVPNTAKGIEQLISKVNGDPVRWAIEGTGTYGRALCDRLVGAGADVVEVPTRLTGKYRTKAGRNKTDKGDATAIARASLVDDCAPVLHHPIIETLRILVTQRHSLVQSQVEAANRIRARLRELDPDSAKAPKRLRSTKAFIELSDLDTGHDSDPHRQALIHVIKIDALNWLSRRQQIRELETRIDNVLPQAGKQLTVLKGIGLIGAATIMANTGDIDRFPTEGHYGSYCGTAPLDASSGRQDRHRLNRWGNRAINQVLHTAIITQLAAHGEAYEYVTKRITENKTKKEAIRAAKRKLNRRVYRILKQHPLT
ncbi:MAG: IS110 family transposase [Acidimicrobiia bacterium]